MFRHIYTESNKEIELIEEIKAEEIQSSDVKAIIIALTQIVIPAAFGIIIVYYLILLFLTKVWL